jgi:hypothetical protein
MTMTNFGWSYPAGAASDPYAPYNQDSIIDNEAVKEAFADYAGPYDLYRAVYKATACGASIGFTFTYFAVETVSEGPCAGEVYETRKSRTVYCDDLRTLGTWKDIDGRGDLIQQIQVSSIVEGVHEGTSTHTVECGTEDCDPDEIRKQFWDAVENVEAEAKAIWDDTHGCDTCCKHWEMEEGEMCPVWTECPECNGHGIVI